MHGFGATLAWALPVDAETFAVRLQTHFDSLPALTELRLCLRFGIKSKLPVELVKQITNCHVEHVRTEVAEAASRCIENRCTILDHVEDWELLDMHHDFLRHKGQEESWEDWKIGHNHVPDKNKLLDTLLSGRKLGNSGLGLDDHEEKYQTRHFHDRYNWEHKFQDILSKENRLEFTKRFGLSMWSSSVRLDDDYHSVYGEHWGPSVATVMYLTLPRTATRSKSWQTLHDDREKNEATNWLDRSLTGSNDMRKSDGCNGFGFALEGVGSPTDEQLGRFPLALKHLDLKVFVHRSQRGPALSLESSERASGFQDSSGLDFYDELQNPGDNDNGDDDTAFATSFPRPMLLFDNYDSV